MKGVEDEKGPKREREKKKRERGEKLIFKCGLW